MTEKIKEYQSKDLTVIWSPSKCIHSEICYKGLSDVFDPNQRPWINVDGANDDAIQKQIDKCPSGALSYKLHNADSQNDDTDEGKLVEVIKGGPLMVSGSIAVKHHDGSVTSKDRLTAFCRCGASSNKPYCDGSHKKIDFEG